MRQSRFANLGGNELGGVNADGLPEQSRRDAPPNSEWTNAPCRRRARSHAATAPPSIGATARSSALLKTRTVYLASSNTTLGGQTYIRRCCIDLLRPPALIRVSRSLASRSRRAYPIGGTLALCNPFGIPSTSHWTGAAIIVQFPRTKTCIVTRSRTSTRPMPSSLAG